MKLKDYMQYLEYDTEVTCWDSVIDSEFYFYKPNPNDEPDEDFPNVENLNQYLIEHLEIESIKKDGVMVRLYDFLANPAIVQYAKDHVFFSNVASLSDEAIVELLFDDMITNFSYGYENFSGLMLECFESTNAKEYDTLTGYLIITENGNRRKVNEQHVWNLSQEFFDNLSFEERQKLCKIIPKLMDQDSILNDTEQSAEMLYMTAVKKYLLAGHLVSELLETDSLNKKPDIHAHNRKLLRYQEEYHCFLSDYRISKILNSANGSKGTLESIKSLLARYGSGAVEQGYTLLESSKDSLFPDCLMIVNIPETNEFPSGVEASVAARKNGVRFIDDVEGLQKGLIVEEAGKREVCKKILEQYPAYRVENLYHPEEDYWKAYAEHYGVPEAHESQKLFNLVFVNLSEEEAKIHTSMHETKEAAEEKRTALIAALLEELGQDAVYTSEIKAFPKKPSIDTAIKQAEKRTVHNTDEKTPLQDQSHSL